MDKVKKFLKSPLFNVIILLLITFIVYKTLISSNIELIKESFSQSNPWIMLLCVVLALSTVFFSGFALNTYGQLFNKKFNILAGIEACFIGAMAGGILPFGSGTQVFQFYVFRKYESKPSDAVSVLFIDFIVYQATMILTILALILLKFNKFTSVSNWFWLVILGFIINSFILVMLVLLAKSKKAHQFVTSTLINFLSKIKIVKNKNETLESLNSQIEQFREAQNILFSNKKALLIGVVANFLRLITLHVLPYFIALSLGIKLNGSQLIDVIALSAFVAQLNAFFPTPGASGGTEVVFKTMFEPLFSTFTLGVLVVWRFLTYYLIVLIGSIVFIKVKQFKPKESED